MDKSAAFTHLAFIKDSFCKEDQLGFDRYVTALGDMITDARFQTPFCIGIHGKWGSGKTSFMKLLQNNLEKKEGVDVAPISVWFNPWRYAKEEHLIIPFLKTIASALESHAAKDTQPDLLKDSAKKISTAARAIAYGVHLNFFGLALSGKDMVEREEKLEEGENGVVTKDLPDIYYNIIEHLTKAVDEKKFRLVIFIDDLDRCLPEQAVELLEAMKLFLDLPGYLFVLGVDRDVVETGIRHHYKYGEQKSAGNDLAEKYLEKMIQMPMELPPVESSRELAMIEKLLADSSLSGQAELIKKGVAGRPRDIIRFINFLAFFCRLAEGLKKSIDEEDNGTGQPDNWQELVQNYFGPEFYTKWALLTYGFRAEHTRITGKTSHFFELQKAAKGEKTEDTNCPEKLAKVLAHGTPLPEDIWLVQKYIHLAVSVAVKPTIETVVYSFPSLVSATDREIFLGQMVQVPAGSFLYGEEKEPRNIDNDYAIDVFPVTNAQFCRFLNDNHQGEGVPKDNNNYQLIHLDRSRLFVRTDSFNIVKGYDIHPVTGVTWNGAQAFCSWRTETAEDKDEEYRLPTEVEWEKAARGDNGYEYPWGDEFDSYKCNTDESNIGDTTEVNRYPQGKSPYGCYDMAGNVWEWISDYCDKGEDSYVLRGGGWLNVRSAARCAYRFGGYPVDWYNIVGFRCARSIK